MSHTATAGNSPAAQFTKLRETGQAIEELAVEYHSAIQPIRDAAQVVADVRLEDRDLWADAVNELAKLLLEHGLADEPARLEHSERWRRQFEYNVGSAIAGQEFCATLASAIAGESQPAQFYATLDEHSCISISDATREICAVLTELLAVHKVRTAPSFVKRYQQIVAESGVDNEPIYNKLARCGLRLTDTAQEAVNQWEDPYSGTRIVPNAIRPNINSLHEISEVETPHAQAHEQCERIALTPTLHELPEATTEEKLTQRQELILIEMFSADVTKERAKLTQAEIVQKCQRNTDPNSWKRDFSDLKKLGYINSTTGCSGGCWLTGKGMELAQKLRNPD